MPTQPQVLLAVSEPSDRALLLAELSAAGIEAASVDDLLEAVLYQLNDAASVILCDADRFDWTETLDVLNRVVPRTRVVFFSRAADDRLWLNMLDAGAHDLIEKPWRDEDLRWVIDSALRPARSAFAAARCA